jgi:cholesterol oxidase
MPFDALVVGSGFGGSVCAARLAERGMRVLILERRPWWGPLQRSHPKSDRREFARG